MASRMDWETTELESAIRVLQNESTIIKAIRDEFGKVGKKRGYMATHVVESDDEGEDEREDIEVSGDGAVIIRGIIVGILTHTDTNSDRGLFEFTEPLLYLHQNLNKQDFVNTVFDIIIPDPQLWHSHTLREVRWLVENIIFPVTNIRYHLPEVTGPVIYRAIYYDTLILVL